MTSTIPFVYAYTESNMLDFINASLPSGSIFINEEKVNLFMELMSDTYSTAVQLIAKAFHWEKILLLSIRSNNESTIYHEYYLKTKEKLIYEKFCLTFKEIQTFSNTSEGRLITDRLSFYLVDQQTNLKSWTKLWIQKITNPFRSSFTILDTIEKISGKWAVLRKSIPHLLYWIKHFSMN